MLRKIARNNDARFGALLGVMLASAAVGQFEVSFVLGAVAIVWSLIELVSAITRD